MDDTNEHEAGGGSAASRKDRGRLCTRSCARYSSAPHSPESTGSKEISFVTFQNVNGKEVQAFGGYGISDWKISWPKSEILHLLVGWGPWLIQYKSLGDAGAGPVLSCLFVRSFEDKAKEANFDVSVRSRPGDVGQWFAPHEVEGRVMSKPVVRTQRKKKEERRSKH
jgi:hypothetical protein